MHQIEDTFDDVLPIDSPGHEHDRAHGSGDGILCGPDPRGFDDDVVDDSRDDHEVGQED